MGKWSFKKANRLPRGAVRFRLKTNARIFATGAINADGSFTLLSIVNRERASGAMAGVYRAEYVPPVGFDQQESYSPRLVNEEYTVVPGDNEFTLTLQRRSRK